MKLSSPIKKPRVRKRTALTILGTTLFAGAVVIIPATAAFAYSYEYAYGGADCSGSKPWPTLVSYVAGEVQHAFDDGGGSTWADYDNGAYVNYNYTAIDIHSVSSATIWSDDSISTSNRTYACTDDQPNLED